MKYSKIRKTVMLTSAAAVLAGGTAALVQAYQSGNMFAPSGSDQEIQANQVVFSDDTGNDLNQEEKDTNSDLWEKDQTAKNQERPQGTDGTGYLYETGRTDLSQINLASLGNVGNGAGTVSGSNGNGTIYDLVENGNGADLILPGGSGIGGTAGTGGNGSGSGTGTSGKNDGNSQNSSQNGNSGDHGTDSEPSKSWASSAKDPESSKNNPSIGTGTGGIVTKQYNENSVSNAENILVCIQKPTDWDSELLYKGQSVTARTLYYALETYVVLPDATQYVWGAEDYEKYVRVDGISFDGGKTFITDFPVTIPTDLEEGKMVIKVSYRLSVSSSEWTEQLVDYEPENTKLYVLSEQIKEENAVIDPSTIVNTFSLYPQVGTKENLFYDLSNMLGSDELNELFPGWMEDGELVPWFYEIKAGRHILEPADMVPLNDKYKVSLKLYWMSDDFEVGFQYPNLCYLQTLTDCDDDAMLVRAAEDAGLLTKYGVEIQVPEYVQAIDFAEGSDTVIQYMHVPDTVLYINDTKGNLMVHKGWDVSEDNPRYASTEDGMLMNKEETEVLGVPTEVEKITIPETVTKVSLTSQNQIRELCLEAQTIDAMPDITYGNLKDCTIYVQDGLLEAFVEQNQDTLEKGTDLTVALESDPGTVYHVENDFLIDNSDMICRALPGSTSRKIPADVKGIKSGAFTGSEIETLILPDGVSGISLEENSFADSTLSNIFCYTEEQYERMTAQKNYFGAEYIEVQLLSVSTEGIAYSRHTKDNVETVTLVSAPESITSFDGTVTSLQDGRRVVITEIGDNAFANCQDLQWVMLPESVKKIGYQAFVNCTSLQGLLINSKDSITIGNKAVDGCTSLRFIASNAHMGIMEDGYEPVVSDSYGTALEPNYYFYVPTNPAGYCSTSLYFTPESKVDGYTLVDCGETGKVLYGFTYGENKEKNTWLALRSGGILDAAARLPLQTTQIFEYAFADTVSVTGIYHVNWSELSACSILRNGAFRNSDLGEDVVLRPDYDIGNYAFADCEKIKAIEIPGERIVNIGESAFTGCTELTTVKIGTMQNFAFLYNYLFNGCNKLTDIYLKSAEPCGLILQGNLAFRFNSDWTEEEEQEKLTVHVPDGSEDTYIKAWRYQFAGYYSTPERSAYEQMWNAVEADLFYEYWEWPTEEQVKEALTQKLLSSENRLRALLGTDLVSEPADFYPYRVENGCVTLIGAPSDITNVTLYGLDLDLPDGWTLDYIGARAFSGSPNLESVTIPETLAGIEPDAFAGVKGNLTLIFKGEETPPSLFTDENGDFSFGVEAGKLHIQVPSGCENLYLNTWTAQLAGTEDEGKWNQIYTWLSGLMGANTIENAETDSADEPEDMDTGAEDIMDIADEDEADMDEEITDSNAPDADAPDKDVTDTDITGTDEPDTNDTESDDTEDTDSEETSESGDDTVKQEDTADDSGTVQTDH